MLNGDIPNMVLIVPDLRLKTPLGDADDVLSRGQKSS
jgi:hypothetical protein